MMASLEQVKSLYEPTPIATESEGNDDGISRSGRSLIYDRGVAWVSPGFGRGAIDLAGALLARGDDSPKYEAALAVVNNWRSSHGYPLLTFRIVLSTRSKKLDSSALVAQRIKRLPSIALKLRLHRHMKLSQMQDLGGCRAIMRSVLQAEKLVRVYETAAEVTEKTKKGPRLIKKYDYVRAPKKDGYRGFHLVYKYKSKARQWRIYDGLRIEIQIRSRLQHVWATAVETVSTFTTQALKYNIGDADWKRFFALMSTAIALRENRPIVPGTPTEPSKLRSELRDLVDKLKVEGVLSGFGSVVQRDVPGATRAAAFLLVLNPKDLSISVTAYRKEELVKASDDYLRAEKEFAGSPGIQVVLVSVSSLKALRSAYPNYYLDTKVFLDAVRAAILEPPIS
jgi:ppGpp synthetase/RelA/SpoT-type nucleotidyltranferase